ncbi:Siroheme synthase [Durusdinium trenchii]|uniref:Siroheme synthase n=1 Tax=Durusdinium trenchii TaxID=1381693 RepID=A0ABP0QTS8_9DINO
MSKATREAEARWRPDIGTGATGAKAAMLYLLWTYMGSGPEELRVKHTLEGLLTPKSISLAHLAPCHLSHNLGQLADKWLDGYVMELVLSMENIFLYHMVLGAFKVPPRMARFALLVVSLFQMVFQMFLFMGIAAFIQDLEILPYLLGAWLIVVGIQTMRDDDEEGWVGGLEMMDEGFDAANSEAYKTCRLALGDRLLPRYDAEGRIFVYQTLFWGGMASSQSPGKGEGVREEWVRPNSPVKPVKPRKVDVTLAKIEEIDNHFIAWSSSVLAAFALPELFVVVCELLRRFYLLKPAISFLVQLGPVQRIRGSVVEGMFFGILLLFRDTIELGDAAELSVMLGIVFGSILVSPLLGYPERSGASYDGLDRGFLRMGEGIGKG